MVHDGQRLQNVCNDSMPRSLLRLPPSRSGSSLARASGLSRVKGSLDRRDVRRLSVKLNIRIIEEERAAFQAVAEASGLTVSEAVRHLVRQAKRLSGHPGRRA